MGEGEEETGVNSSSGRPSPRGRGGRRLFPWKRRNKKKRPALELCEREQSRKSEQQEEDAEGIDAVSVDEVQDAMPASAEMTPP